MRTSFKQYFTALKKRHRAYMERRPHRTFQLTRRRDALRPVELPGYIAFTHYVSKTLWQSRKIFLLLVVVYAALYGVLVGVQSQETFTELSEALSAEGAELRGENWSAFDQAGALLTTIASAGVAPTVTEAQQIFSVLVFLLIWLTTVWLLRNILAGHKVKLRDGIYNAGAPLFSLIMIALLVAVQLLPIALSVIGYNAALSSGLLDSGVAAMLFWVAASLLAILSLYWVTSSLFAMIIVTLPGTYPYQAIRSAGDLVTGRRLVILFRWLWMIACIGIGWVVVLLPTILLDIGIKGAWPAVEWLPVLPFTILLLSSITVVWASAYIYLFYRKVVDYVPEQ